MFKKIKEKEIKTEKLLKDWQEILLIITSEISLEEMLKRSLRITCEALKIKYGTIMFEKEDKPGGLYMVTDYGFSADYVKEVDELMKRGGFSLESSPSGIALSEAKQYVTKNVFTDPRWLKFLPLARHWKYGSLLYTPLRVKEKEKPFGLIVLYKEKTYPTENKAFPKEERNFVATIARPIAITVENVRLYEKLKKWSETLAQQVRERTKALEKEKEELKKARTAALNILEDVEEARAKMEEEKDKTQTIIANFTDGLLVFDKNESLSLINNKTEEIFGIKTEEIIGKSILELTKITNLNPLVNLLKKGMGGIYRKELPIKENLTLEISTVPMTSRKEILGTLVILHDISREKMIEKMKTEFVSLAAHQLRTPISAIKWTLRMILDGDLGEITKEQRDFLEKTYLSNERMINLINDLLDVARIEEGRYLYKPIFAHIEDVVQFVINSYKTEIERRKINFNFKKPEKKSPRIKIDVEKIRLAIQNILDNAIKYTLPGGTVTVSLKYDKKEIELSVRDSGVGIPRDQQERVFSKFFRGVNVTKMETDGSGLGLYITKNIIEAHGGKIWFESEKNKGTAFHLTLPIVEELVEFLKEF